MQIRGFHSIILWDGPEWQQLLPFTFTRPVSYIRCGINNIKEKYQCWFSASNVTPLTVPYLREVFKPVVSEENFLINSAILPDENFIQSFLKLKLGESLWQDEIFLAAKVSEEEINRLAEKNELPKLKRSSYNHEIILLDRIWKIFLYCDKEIRKDIKLITSDGRKNHSISSSNRVYNEKDIFIEEGAIVEGASLNATTGPIYIGPGAEVMEGSLIRGPFSLDEHAVVKMGAKIYGATSVGPYCKVGGEINNAVFFGYSNKAHDGFIGNAVIGEWCNIGADSNNSNLKNNYEEVKVWSYAEKSFLRTGEQFCGLFMGDHSKCGINTMFNTGTVVGVSANIFGGGFPRTFIPSFSWGGASGFINYKLEKAFETADRVMKRRNLDLTDADKKVLEKVFKMEMSKDVSGLEFQASS
jgi:UDP-N-acetylglucosamine diphosphorylase/glucosamine-1-phosphate N-acetyltransferase